MRQRSAAGGATFKPAGLDKSKGILSAGFLKDIGRGPMT